MTASLVRIGVGVEYTHYVALVDGRYLQQLRDQCLTLFQAVGIAHQIANAIYHNKFWVVIVDSIAHLFESVLG